MRGKDTCICSFLVNLHDKPETNEIGYKWVVVAGNRVERIGYRNRIEGVWQGSATFRTTIIIVAF